MDRSEPYTAVTTDVAGKVFISYASQDLAVAEKLCAALEAASLPSANHWLDASGGPIERILPALIESVRGWDASISDRETRATGGAAPSSRWRKPALVAVLAVMAVGLAYVLAERKSLVEAIPAIADKSVAVLPLVNMSGDDKDSYLGDGISGAILSALSQLPGLRVIGRASSFQFRDRDVDALKVGGAHPPTNR